MGKDRKERARGSKKIEERIKESLLSSLPSMEEREREQEDGVVRDRIDLSLFIIFGPVCCEQTQFSTWLLKSDGSQHYQTVNNRRITPIFPVQ